MLLCKKKYSTAFQKTKIFPNSVFPKLELWFSKGKHHGANAHDTEVLSDEGSNVQLSNSYTHVKALKLAEILSRVLEVAPKND